MTRDPLTPKQVADAVCEALEIDKDGFYGFRRTKEVTFARMAASRLCRLFTTRNYQEIADGIGLSRGSMAYKAEHRIDSKLDMMFLFGGEHISGREALIRCLRYVSAMWEKARIGGAIESVNGPNEKESDSRKP